jgi:hypothetical protein
MKMMAEGCCILETDRKMRSVTNKEVKVNKIVT